MNDQQLKEILDPINKLTKQIKELVDQMKNNQGSLDRIANVLENLNDN